MNVDISGLVTDLMTAASNCALYTKNHEAVSRYSLKAADLIDKMLPDGEMSFTILGDTVLFNDAPYTGTSLHIMNFVKGLRRKGVEKVILKKGVSASEIIRFVADLTSPSGKLSSSERITVGAVTVKLKQEGDIRVEIDEATAKIGEVHHGLAKFKKLDMIGLEEVVTSFISTLNRESNILRVVSPIKTHSEYTFAHTTNVTILTLFMAESLGIKGSLLHEIGLAGLLHDVGKMFIPIEILHKEGALDKKEWEIMKMHTVYGAMYLSTLKEVPKLSIVSAFEHHMRFNGTGYPDTKRRGKKQHIVSQIVAIADFFDALRTERPYRKTMGVPVIIGLLKESSGKEFNPILVENFINTLKTIKVL